MLKPHIVILGAGFGGVYAAKKFIPEIKAGKVEVTIINRTNYFLFTPLLHEVATGSLSPNSVAEPLREVFAGVDINILQTDILGIDTSAKEVSTTVGKIGFDYLILATGADTNYYDIPGAEKFCLPLKNLADAVAIRAHIINAFEEAVLAPTAKERLHLLSFAVIGGGATGVEMAAELSDFIDDIVDRYYHHPRRRHDGPGTCIPEEPAVTLVHSGEEILQQFAPSLRKSVSDHLTRRGVSVQTGSTVTSVTKAGLTLANNMSIAAHTVIWTAGVKPHIPHFEGEQPQIAAGRLAVDGHFKLIGHDRVFAFGDVAAYIEKGEEGKPLPMLAQVAVQQADIVVHNIIASIQQKPLSVFKYKSKGNMVSIGQWFAIGEIFSFKIAGRFAWWIWRTVYLFKFASWKKRFRIMFEWTLDMFYPRDITKL